jgi:multidrug resistance efflux pump
MEILVTIAYFFLVRLVFFEYGWISFNLFWKFVAFGLYGLAALTEIVMLGQYTPYSKLMYVQQPVLQMAPEFGGIVKAVPVEPNALVDAGTVLFEMDPTTWQAKVAELTPQLAIAQRNYDDALALVTAQVEKKIALVRRRDELASIKAEIETAQYRVDHAKIIAPVKGYVINLQLRAGEFIRIKQPVMTFIASEDQWIVAMIRQRATQHVVAGSRAQVAFEMYPGKVFEAKVDNIIYGIGNSQFVPSGVLPTQDQFRPADSFLVKLALVNPDPNFPLRFGASGLATIFGQDAPDVFILLRRLEIQSEAFLMYLYNPFG